MKPIDTWLRAEARSCLPALFLGLLLPAAGPAAVTPSVEGEAAFPATPEIRTYDPAVAGTDAERTVMQTASLNRILAQTFRVPAEVEVGRISLLYERGITGTTARVRVFPVANTGAASIQADFDAAIAGGFLLDAVFTMPSTPYEEKGLNGGVDRTLILTLSGGDIFTLPATTGTAGYAIAFQAVDADGGTGVLENAFTWRFREANPYSDGRTYYDTFSAGSTTRDASLAIGGPPLPLAAADDHIEVGTEGAISFDPTLNDEGNPQTVSVVQAPDHGAAHFDPVQGKLVYRHTGGTAGTDSFRYRIEKGAEASEATVHVSVSGALRLENRTLAMPSAAPPAGSLELVDAFPGLTIDGMVTITSVPGHAKSLLVASIHGASTGSDSKVWMIPDVTATPAQKFELFEVDSLCPQPFTQGRAIYSAVCHPDFAANGHIIVCYQGAVSHTANTGRYDDLPPLGQIPNLQRDGAPYSTITCTLRVSRFTVSPANLELLLNPASTAQQKAAARAAILASELRYINLAEQDYYHSINDCHFGPDGYLYVSFGDEGEQSDNYRNTQSITKDQYSSIIRIDTEKKPGNPEPNPHYAIPINPDTGLANFSVPADNPYVGSNASYNGITYTPAHPDFGKVRTEIWATGFRNPFKFELTGSGGNVSAWVGDVGHQSWEKVVVIGKGDNAGWSYWEGNHTVGFGHSIQPPAHKAPIHEYPHANGNRCVIGGVFYQGNAYTAPMQGKYLFGDHRSHRLWLLDPALPPGSNVQNFGTLTNVIDFHTDPATGEILLAQYQSTKKIWRLRESQAAGDFPAKLSETGAFADMATLEPNPGVVPYEPNLAFWSDHAEKRRFFAMADAEDRMGYSEDGNWDFPEGMVAIKHFDMDLDRDQPGMQAKRLETRFLVRNAGGVYGVSYRWNEEGTDAILAGPGGEDFDLEIVENGATSTRRWRIPARAECTACHNPDAGHLLSLGMRQLNAPGRMNAAAGNFLSLLSQAAYLDGFGGDPAALGRYFRPGESGADLEDRVRSYLAVNCGYCHRPDSGIAESWDGRGHLGIDAMRLLNTEPQSESYHAPGAVLVKPGDLAKSEIWNRLQARDAIGGGTFNGYSQMPPLATNVVDEAGVALLTEWILHHANTAPEIAAGSPASVSLSENAPPGTVAATIQAVDPDLREGVADADLLEYSIASGNEHRWFSIGSASGVVTVNGLLDFERRNLHSLRVTATDRFGPNPKSTDHWLDIGLQDVTAGDASEDADGDGTPDLWAALHGAGGADGDPEHDGVSNFFEWLGDSDPATPDIASSVALRAVARVLEPVPGQVLEWRVRNGVILGQHYEAQVSTGLGADWSTLQEGDYVVQSAVPDRPGTSILRVFVPAAEPAAQGFFRLRSPSQAASP